MITLNDKRKKIESATLENIDFAKIEKENKNIIFFYNPNINEGLLGIIAARLKDYFDKPAIVITNSNDLLKGSARSIYNYNIGRAIRNSLLEKLILNGGGHNMAAGFTLQKENLSNFKRFIFNDYSNNSIPLNSIFEYDAQISSGKLNKVFFDEINKIGPFGNGNPLPTFLLKDLKIIKSTIFKGKYISCILKSKIGSSINSISFHSLDSRIGVNLLNY